ncbi:hypothetical protein ADUPG1_002456, partial [Aduncisulcus paluster]
MKDAACNKQAASCFGWESLQIFQGCYDFFRLETFGVVRISEMVCHGSIGFDD